MASTQDLARDYARRLRTASDQKAEVQAIAAEIDSLTYTDTGGPITFIDKQRIVEGMNEEFSISTKGATGILKEADNKKYLDLVKELQKLL